MQFGNIILLQNDNTETIEAYSLSAVTSTSHRYISLDDGTIGTAIESYHDLEFKTLSTARKVTWHHHLVPLTTYGVLRVQIAGTDLPFLRLTNPDAGNANYSGKISATTSENCYKANIQLQSGNKTNLNAKTSMNITVKIQAGWAARGALTIYSDSSCGTVLTAPYTIALSTGASSLPLSFKWTSPSCTDAIITLEASGAIGSSYFIDCTP